MAGGVLTFRGKASMLLFETTMDSLAGLISIREAARRLGIHEESLRRIVRIGTLPARKLGGQWYIDKEQFNAFVATYDSKTGKRRRMI